MGRTLIAALGAVTACVSGGTADAPAATFGDLRVSNVYMAEPVTADVAALYFAVTNEGETADILDGVSAEFAARGELHEQTRDGAGVRMQPLASIAVPAGSTTVLRPGARHVMLVELARVPERGDTVHVVLRFRRAGGVRVPVPVVGYDELEAMAGER